MVNNISIRDQYIKFGVIIFIKIGVIFTLIPMNKKLKKLLNYY